MDADSYTFMRVIANSQDLTPTQKLVGMVVALHYNRASKCSRVRRETICRQTGLGICAVKSALQKLVEAQVFEPKRTGRATIYRVGKRVEEWMVCHVYHQTVCEVSHQDFDPAHALPWEYDPKMTSHGEEAHKRGIW